MKYLFYILIFLLAGNNVVAQKTTTIRFENTANKKPIVLSDSFYTDGFGEKYTVSKLKYYVSNIHFVTVKKSKKIQNVFLIDAAVTNEIILPRPEGQIKGIEFLLGVDSALNCSGAQSGALDPLNDMFWTWNSGYVMFKLEGKSDSSKADQQRLELHIGGYKGEYKTMRKVFIPYKDDPKIKKQKLSACTINMDLDRLWIDSETGGSTRISATPMIMTPGSKAKKMADNFSNMFWINAVTLEY